MKNILGHDSDSELKTIIARLRENKFTVVSADESSIVFEINLKFYNTVPVSNTHKQTIKFVITKILNGYELEQMNGMSNRSIPFSDGYIIWELLINNLKK